MVYNVSGKTIAQSHFEEDSSSSSPLRGRIPSRTPATPSYGHLGRVPLHRRGTSQTYERLEDLLKEAGYKETKISTPETERTESCKEDRSGRGSVRSGMGVVVDYISGWMPGSSGQSDQPDANTRRREESLSPSPLASNRASGRFDGSYRRGLRPRSSASDSLRAYAQRAAAQGHLRHMASTPNMAKRNVSNMGKRSSSSRNQEHPPMPTNWLTSVSEAVAGASTSGARVGGPSSRRVSIRSPHNSAGGNGEGKMLSANRANRIRPLTNYLQPKTAPNALSTVNVLCRSAPTSRSSSCSGDRRAFVATKGKQRAMRQSKGKSSKSADSVPSLSSTLLENDTWDIQWIDGRRVSTALSDEPDDIDSDDDDEGELDLARILVDPKRQNSIHSLRRHLHRSESVRVLRERATNSREPWMLDDDEDGTFTRKGSKLRLSSRRASIEDGGAFAWGDVPGFDLPQPKRRRGIPGTWSSRHLRS